MNKTLVNSASAMLRNVIVSPAAYPPPVSGRTEATMAVLTLLEQAGFETVRINTMHAVWEVGSQPSRVRRGLTRLRALLKFAIVCFHRHKHAIMYLPQSAGWGQLSEIVYVSIARLARMPIVIHHHSFSYIDAKERLAQTLFWIAGRNANHIVLCDRMCARLKAQYKVCKNVVTLSNFALVDIVPPNKISMDRALRIVGFLSTITLDKGFDKFLKIAREGKLRNWPVRFVAAGSIVDMTCNKLINEATEANLIEYRGPVYGNDKVRFLAEMDLLCFPSRYTNEAEPFVIIEALSYGIPIISTNRGCISALVDYNCGLLLDAVAHDVTPAIDRIDAWLAHADEYAAARKSAADKANLLTLEARNNCANLVDAVFKALANTAA